MVDVGVDKFICLCEMLRLLMEYSTINSTDYIWKLPSVALHSDWFSFLELKKVYKNFLVPLLTWVRVLLKYITGWFICPIKNDVLKFHLLRHENNQTSFICIWGRVKSGWEDQKNGKSSLLHIKNFPQFLSFFFY